MSDSEQLHDDFHDRLTDQALGELLGDRSPPDLTDSILSAVRKRQAVNPALKPHRLGRSHAPWIVVSTTAACLLIVAAMFGALGKWQFREMRTTVAEMDRSAPLVSANMKESQSQVMDQATLPPSTPAAGAEMGQSIDSLSGVDFGTSIRVSESVVGSSKGLPKKADGLAGAGGETELHLLAPGAAGSSPPVTAGRDALGRQLRELPTSQPMPDTAASRASLSSASSPRTSNLATANSPARSERLKQAGGRAASRGIQPQRVRPAAEVMDRGYGTVLPAHQRQLSQSTPVAVENEAKFIFEGRVDPNVQEAAIKRRITDYSERVAELSKQVATGSAASDAKQQIHDLVSDLNRLEKQYDRFQRQRADAGTGPEQSGDSYSRIHENAFVAARGTDAVSTFSIDVDTASYSNVRQYLMGYGQLPPADAVRIEELVNYFHYDYDPPTNDQPFASSIEVATCPWRPEHRLVRVGIQGRRVDDGTRPDSNLVFLVDVSGSMQDANKLPLVVSGLQQLTGELTENDKVAIVVYANQEGLVLPATRGHHRQKILTALQQLRAGGSTAGGAGIQLAYQVAEENYVSGGTNRVILCTDGDFNVGVTNTAALERIVEEKAKSGVFLTVLGFGRGNLNDAMMESISNKGNGNYHYVDNDLEARKVLVRQMSGTLVTIAKDVKIQVEFNPAQAAAYRLLGYENRMLARADFEDDSKDAGEIGAEHSVTAFYEVIPAGERSDVPVSQPLKYQRDASVVRQIDAANLTHELMELRIRYKEPDGQQSKLLRTAIRDSGNSFGAASIDYRFAASVAGFGLLLRDSQYKGDLSIDAVLEIATEGATKDEYGYRKEFLRIVQRSRELGLSRTQPMGVGDGY